jgi:GrpB-like predicted nucleotidyltransferase (UPF0157 family)
LATPRCGSSTSVPGLAAKPILDVDVVIESARALPGAIAKLATVGYEHQGDLGIPGREAFRNPSRDVPRDGSGREWPEHHLYVCAEDSRELARHVALRDHLRAHPAAAREYGDLKRSLARQHPTDIDSYIRGKTAFIEAILARCGLG